MKHSGITTSSRYLVCLKIILIEKLSNIWKPFSSKKLNKNKTARIIMRYEGMIVVHRHEIAIYATTQHNTFRKLSSFASFKT